MKPLFLYIVSATALSSLAVPAAHASSNDPEFQWARQFGSISVETRSVATDIQGNMISAGFYYSFDDFDPGAGDYTINAVGAMEAYVLKLDSNGDFLWARSFGGVDYDSAHSVTTDPQGNVIVAGTFEGTVDFDPGPGTVELASAGPSSTFLVKLDSDGNFLWARAYDQTIFNYYPHPRAIRTDMDGNTFMAVGFEILKISPSGTLQWRRTLSGSGNSVAVAPTLTNEVYLAGTFSGTVDFVPGTHVEYHASLGGKDVFLLKLDGDGNFDSIITLGGTNNDDIISMAVDREGRPHLSGLFSGPVDFDPSPGVATVQGQNGGNFIAKYSPNGSLIWVKGFGAEWSLGSYSSDIAIGNNNNVYITGTHSGSPDFDPGPGVATYPITFPGAQHIVKLNSQGNHLWSAVVDGSVGTSVCIDPNERLLITGQPFGVTIDVDPGPGTVLFPPMSSPWSYMLAMNQPAAAMPLDWIWTLIPIVGIAALTLRRLNRPTGK